MRKSRGAEVPPTFWTDPLMYRGAADQFIGPCDPIKAADTAWGIDLEAEVAVIVTDVPQGIAARRSDAYGSRRSGLPLAPMAVIRFPATRYRRRPSRSSRDSDG